MLHQTWSIECLHQFYRQILYIACNKPIQIWNSIASVQCECNKNEMYDLNRLAFLLTHDADMALRCLICNQTHVDHIRIHTHTHTWYLMQIEKQCRGAFIPITLQYININIVLINVCDSKHSLCVCPPCSYNPKSVSFLFFLIERYLTAHQIRHL